MKASREADARIAELLGETVEWRDDVPCVARLVNRLAPGVPPFTVYLRVPEYTADNREAPALLRRLRDRQFGVVLSGFPSGWFVRWHEAEGHRVGSVQDTLALAASDAFLRAHGEDPETIG